MRPADPRKPARLRQQLRALGYACDARGTKLVGLAARPARLPARNRPRARAGQAVLCRGPSTHWAHAGALHGGTDRRSRGRPRAADSGCGIRFATLLRLPIQKNQGDPLCTHDHSSGPCSRLAWPLTICRLRQDAECRCAPAGDLRRRMEVARTAIRRTTRTAQKPIQDHLPKVDPASPGAAPAASGRRCCRSSMRFRARSSRPAEQLNYDVYHPQIEALIADQQFREFEMPVNSDTTFWTDLGYTARRHLSNRCRTIATGSPDAGHSALLPRTDG